MIEFSLVFLVLLALVVGLMEGARAVWTYTTLAHAAKEGARWAMVRGAANPATDQQIETYVESRAIGVDPAGLTVATAWTPDNSAGSTVEVRLSYNLPLVAAPLFLATTSINLGAVSRMVVLN